MNSEPDEDRNHECDHIFFGLGTRDGWKGRLIFGIVGHAHVDSPFLQTLYFLILRLIQEHALI